MPALSRTSTNTDTADIRDKLSDIKSAVESRESSQAAINTALIGDNEIIATPGAGKHLTIYGILVTVARGEEVDLTLKSGATDLSGAMQGDTYDIYRPNDPLICGTDEAFNIELSAAVAITGLVQYEVVTE